LINYHEIDVSFYGDSKNKILKIPEEIYQKGFLAISRFLKKTQNKRISSIKECIIYDTN